MMRSTQVSGGSALNWSPLQTRHWAEKNRMIRNTCRPEHSGEKYLHMNGLFSGSGLFLQSHDADRVIARLFFRCW